VKKRGNATLIGAFVVGALALVAGAIVLLGTVSWFSTVYKFVLYFDDSVDGLVVGAPVKFKGVQVGSVEQIKLAPTGTVDDPRIAVVIALDETRIESLGGSTAGFTSTEVTQAIERGLRGTLASQSLLTGLLYVSLNYVKDAPPPKSLGKTEFPEIPTVPSRVEQVAQTANEIFKKLQSLDWQGLFDSISQTMDGLRNLVADRETQEVTLHLNDTLETIQQLAKRIDAKIDPLTTEVQDVGRSVRTSLEKIDGTVTELRAVVDPESPVFYELSNTLRELEMAARAIRSLSDSIDRNPSQLIFGKE
jgi:paraquat-inducible protein B